MHNEQNGRTTSHKRHSKYKIDSNSKAPRAQGGEGLLFRSILVQSLKNPWMKFYPSEEREEEQREGREGDGRKGQAAWAPGKRRGREERGYLWCPRRGPKYH